jgi:hypothetical protein
MRRRGTALLTAVPPCDAPPDAAQRKKTFRNFQDVELSELLTYSQINVESFRTLWQADV